MSWRFEGFLLMRIRGIGRRIVTAKYDQSFR
jgi:hypothetical protein